MISTLRTMGFTPCRWMQFVDGKSLTVHSQKLLGVSNCEPRESRFYKKDCFLWPSVENEGFPQPRQAEPWPVRSFYYTSVESGDEVRADAREKIRSLGFKPHVFSYDKQAGRTNAADIALTRDMLTHAFRGNYEIAVLISGGGEYVPIIEEVKSLGKRVYVHFMGRHANPELKLVADELRILHP